MSTAQSSLLENINDDDLELSSSSGSPQEVNTEILAVKPTVARRRASMQEVENLYFTVSLIFKVMYKNIGLHGLTVCGCVF